MRRLNRSISARPSMRESTRTMQSRAVDSRFGTQIRALQARRLAEPAAVAAMSAMTARRGLLTKLASNLVVLRQNILNSSQRRTHLSRKTLGFSPPENGKTVSGRAQYHAVGPSSTSRPRKCTGLASSPAA